MTKSSPDIKRFAGLDLAKESIFVCVIDKEGLKQDEKFLTDLDSLMMLKKWLKKYNVESVVMEHTGIYTEPVKAILRDDFRLELVNPADVKRRNKKKTDTDDAWWLAELLLSGTIGKGKRILSSHLEDEKSIEYKKMTRLRAKYVKQATQQKNRIQRIFDRNNMRITSLFGDNKFTKTSFIVYEAIAQGISWNEKINEIVDLKERLSSKERNKYTRALNFIYSNEEKLESVMNNSTHAELLRIDRIELLMALKLLESFNSFVEIVEYEIKTFIQDNKAIRDQCNLITTIPGIGQTTANQILAEIPDIAVFESQKKFASFTGLAPRVSQSAEVVHIGSITKRGSPYIRQALFQAAKVASMNKDSPIGIKFKRLYERKGKGKGKIAWVAIARHIATIIWCLLTRKEEYRAKNFQKKEYKHKRKLLRKLSLNELSYEIKRRKCLTKGI